MLLVPVDGSVVAESVPYAVPDVGLKCPVCHLKLNNCFSYFSSTLWLSKIKILISAVGGIHILVSTNRESEWKLAKFCYCPSTSQLVNHSIFRTEAFDEILL